MNDRLLSIIAKAMDKEKKAYEFYIAMMNEADTPNLKSFFRTLALQEMKHESLLKELLQTGDITAARARIEQRFDTGISFDLHVTVSIHGILNAFRIALKMEIEAQILYIEASRAADEPGAADLFNALASEEKEHEALLQKEYQNMKS